MLNIAIADLVPQIDQKYKNIISTHTFMSFLDTKIINPHLLLHALSFPPLNKSESTPLKRLSLLARTRRFDEILAASENHPFPTLAKKLAQAKDQSEKEKKQLGVDTIIQKIKQLEELSKGQDPNFEKIDSEQQKVFRLAQILFQQGNYTKSLQILIQLEKQDLKQELWIKSTWARLYNEIILSKDSTKSIESLKKKIEDIQNDQLPFYIKEKKDTSKIMKKFYAQKEEFLLLSCFSFWSQNKSSEENLQKFVEYCTSDKSYFSVVQLTFPELLRYIIVAIALNKTLHNNRTFDLFKLVEVINRKIVNYTDSFTEYISLLHIEYDFEAATSKIQQCRQQIRNDIFLAPLEERIIEGLQFLYFKLACKVYQTIPLSEVSSFTGKSIQDAELWILSYIRSGDIEAKIDSIAEIVINNKGRQNQAERYVDVIPTLNTFVNSLSRAIANQ